MTRDILKISLLLLFALSACSKPPPEITLVAMDLVPCLGAVDGVEDQMAFENDAPPIPSTCRDRLMSTLDVAPATTVNVCLAIESSSGQAHQVGFKFNDGRLGPPLDDVKLAPGRNLKAALYFLAKGGTSSTHCSRYTFGSDCADNPDCILRLYTNSVTPDEDGQTVIRFTQSGGSDGESCQLEQGPSLSTAMDAAPSEVVERCDGRDNDCDRKIDEGYQEGQAMPFFGEACEAGVGACNRKGKYVCGDDEVSLKCDAPIISPEVQAGPDPCNDGEPIDDDCDGEIDEGSPACFVCQTDMDCIRTNEGTGLADVESRLFCINNRCEVCDPGATDVDPGSLTHRGCTIEQLCCSTDGKISCVDTTAERCLGCDIGCGTDADGCLERQCACGAESQCAAPQAFCIDQACIECRSNDDCSSNELCCDTRCVETSALTGCEACNEPCGTDANTCNGRSCACGDRAEACTELGRTFCAIEPGSSDETAAICTGCRSSEDCPNNGKCIPDPEQPTLNVCVPCTSRLDCNRQPNRPECIDNECVACNPDVSTFDGCDPAGLTPVCKRQGQNGTPLCVPCSEHSECLNNDTGSNGLNFCVEGRCRVCDTDTNDGCAANPITPICHSPADDVRFVGEAPPPAFQCRGCKTSDECGDGRECEQMGVDAGKCSGCDPATGSGCFVAEVRPICDVEQRECRGCLDDNECMTAPGVSDTGRTKCVQQLSPGQARCQVCDAGRGRANGCDPIGSTPICSTVGICEGCNTDPNCVALYPDTYPICVNSYCQVCRPTDNQGCDISSDTPVCVRTDDGDDNAENDRFACGLCTDDEACRRGLEPEVAASVFCQNGRCSGCVEGPTSEGCDNSSNRPFCDGGECRGCETDQECPLGDDGVTHQRCDTRDGTCRDCLSYKFENSGCDVNSATPICDFETNTCQGCNDTLRCALIGGPDVCVGGACRECDPDGSIGCTDENPVCADFRCGPCTSGEQCQALDPTTPYCVDGLCTVCNPANSDGCNDVSRSVCDSETRTCRPCRVDSEAQDCPNATPRCVEGICRECSPFRVDDCPARDPSRPVCDRDQKVCLGCSSGFQCGDIDAGKPTCLPDGACAVCNVETAEGCTSNRPICREINGEPACVPCSVNAQGDADCARLYGANSMCVNGQCEGCNPDEPGSCTNPGTPICSRNNSCIPCSTDGQCADQQPGTDICVQGACEVCNPLNSDGCDIATERPICTNEADGYACGQCQTDDQCAFHIDNDTSGANAGRRYCVDGRCRSCDPENTASCPDIDQRVCRNDLGGPDNNACGPCQNPNNPCPNGDYCVPINGGNTECHTCTPFENGGCTADAPICDRAGGNSAYACRACANDGECGDGKVCYEGRCTECNPLTQAGCNDEARPFCARDNDNGGYACRACETSRECQSANAAGAVCHSGRCVTCSPTTDEGCDANSDRPVCREANDNFRCRGCNQDIADDCGNQGANCLADGSCDSCEVGTNAGCQPDQPVCQRLNNQNVCVPCSVDGDCANYAGLPICHAGECVQCDPTKPTGAQGCGANQRCCDAVCLDADVDNHCEACNAGACGEADTCENFDCKCGDENACSENPNAPFCVGLPTGGACEECRNDGDCDSETAPFCIDNQCAPCSDAPERCGGQVCIEAGPRNGACGECNPVNDIGCVAGGNTPECDIATGTCVGCEQGDENVCALRLGQTVCVDQGPGIGRCAECNPTVQPTTCGDATPICDANDWNCRACDPSEQPSECAGGVCIDGACAECDPNMQPPGCPAQRPICDGVSRTCRSCQSDADPSECPENTVCSQDGACVQE